MKRNCYNHITKLFNLPSKEKIVAVACLFIPRWNVLSSKMFVTFSIVSLNTSYTILTYNVSPTTLFANWIITMMSPSYLLFWRQSSQWHLYWELTSYILTKGSSCCLGIIVSFRKCLITEITTSCIDHDYYGLL